MNSNDMAIGARQTGIVLLCIIVFAGTLIVYWLPLLSKPIIYKFKQASFVHAQGEISKVTIYESYGAEKKTTGGVTVSGPFSAYYVRVWVDYTFNGKPYRVEVKKYKGQHETLQEAYTVVRNIAPVQDVGLEFYRKKKIDISADVSFLKKLRTPQQSQQRTDISFMVNPHNPKETSLSDQKVPFVWVASFVGTILIYAILLSFAWVVLFYFGKWRILSSVLVLSVIGINIVLSVVIKQHQQPEDYMLLRKPHFSVMLGPNYTYEQVKPYVEEE